ncbi:MAG TPA: patatin-like phospholipase family protein [Nocardioidaceae bacterium]|nr:patatin-like phospholipase family protein [Nocardioidaceae bacterium]
MSPSAPRTALVLGGGGVTGISWELGLLKGLVDGGVDLSGADVVVGTSAGSVVGAQVSGKLGLDDLYDGQLGVADAEVGGKFGLSVMLRLAVLGLLPGDGPARRRRIGRAALRTHPESSDERVRMVEARLGVVDWPETDLRVTAVDADTGELRVFDGSDGVDLAHAVAASCAVPLVWPPVAIDGHRYVDGGIRSTANADLVSGCDRVVVIAPLPQSFSKHHAIPAQLARLGEHVRSAAVSPDKAALKAIGKDVLDTSRCAESAGAGRDQAASVLDEVRAAWHG